jgi:hypothetical protein
VKAVYQDCCAEFGIEYSWWSIPGYRYISVAEAV